MGTKNNFGIALFVLFVVFGSGCVNYTSVEDFSAGTNKFASSYNSVYSGSYDTCLSTAELRNVILELGETPSRSPLTQLQDDKAICAPYKATTEAFSESSLALVDFSKGLNLVASKNQFGSGDVTFVPSFSGINEDSLSEVPQLAGHGATIIGVNKWKDYFGSFFIQKSPQEMILETHPQLQDTLTLLGVLAQVYQVQLANYERNIKVLDTLIEDTQSTDAIKRAFVINRGRDQISRQDFLINYNQALEAVNVSYTKIYQRSELSSPKYNDPIFQQDMKEFMINISNLVQQSTLISN